MMIVDNIVKKVVVSQQEKIKRQILGIKCFALWPIKLKTGNWIWLHWYWRHYRGGIYSNGEYYLYKASRETYNDLFSFSFSKEILYFDAYLEQQKVSLPIKDTGYFYWLK